jgi:hypothetical protein
MALKSSSSKGYIIEAKKIIGILIKKENLAALVLSAPKNNAV